MSALALDRQAVEKQDFPIARRGYEPAAVDRHLQRLAAELDRLQEELAEARSGAAAASGGQGLAFAASDQVRVILEAAERSAAEIQRAAQDQADRLLHEAETEARRTREAAMAISEGHVGGVSEAAAQMLQRVDAMEGELGALLDGLRTGSSRLAADLSQLQGSLGDLHGAAGTGAAPAARREPVREEPVRERPASVREEPVEEPVAAREEPARRREPQAPRRPQPQPKRGRPGPGRSRPEPAQREAAAPAPAAAAAPAQGQGDVEGARLIALNMALNGQSRDETDAYLRDNFDLGDRGALLDEVYATVEG